MMSLHGWWLIQKVPAQTHAPSLQHWQPEVAAKTPKQRKNVAGTFDRLHGGAHKRIAEMNEWIVYRIRREIVLSLGLLVQ